MERKWNRRRRCWDRKEEVEKTGRKEEKGGDLEFKIVHAGVHHGTWIMDHGSAYRRLDKEIVAY